MLDPENKIYIDLDTGDMYDITSNNNVIRIGGGTNNDD